MESQTQLFASPQQAKTSDDYYTPAWIFDALGLHFDLDVASPPHATHVPCDRYLTIEDDGLNSEWHGRVWMNPPFSKTTPWVQRWREHANGIALLPWAKSAWLNDLWNDTNAMCVPLPPHTKFVGGEPFSATALWAIGHDNIKALHNIGQVR